MEDVIEDLGEDLLEDVAESVGDLIETVRVRSAALDARALPPRSPAVRPPPARIAHRADPRWDARVLAAGGRGHHRPARGSARGRRAREAGGGGGEGRGGGRGGGRAAAPHAPPHAPPHAAPHDSGPRARPHARRPLRRPHTPRARLLLQVAEERLEEALEADREEEEAEIEQAQEEGLLVGIDIRERYFQLADRFKERAALKNYYLPNKVRACPGLVGSRPPRPRCPCAVRPPARLLLNPRPARIEPRPHQMSPDVRIPGYFSEDDGTTLKQSPPFFYGGEAVPPRARLHVATIDHYTERLSSDIGGQAVKLSCKTTEQRLHAPSCANVSLYSPRAYSDRSARPERTHATRTPRARPGPRPRRGAVLRARRARRDAPRSVRRTHAAPPCARAVQVRARARGLAGHARGALAVAAAAARARGARLLERVRGEPRGRGHRQRLVEHPLPHHLPSDQVGPADGTWPAAAAALRSRRAHRPVPARA